MSEEQLKAFLDKVKGETSLQEKLKAAANANAVTAIAKEVGFSISADDLTKAQSELSEEELESMAGGMAIDPGIPDDQMAKLTPKLPGICLLTGAFGGTQNHIC